MLLDFMMPIMDGPTMLKTDEKEPAYCDIPAVIMSSLPESYDRRGRGARLVRALFCASRSSCRRCSKQSKMC